MSEATPASSNDKACSNITRLLDYYVTSNEKDGWKLLSIEQKIQAPRENQLASEEDIKELEALEEKVQKRLVFYKGEAEKWKDRADSAIRTAKYTCISPVLFIIFVIASATLGLRYVDIPMVVRLMISGPAMMLLVAGNWIIKHSRSSKSDPPAEQPDLKKSQGWQDTITTSDLSRRQMAVIASIQKSRPLKSGSQDNQVTWIIVKLLSQIGFSLYSMFRAFFSRSVFEADPVTHYYELLNERCFEVLTFFFFLILFLVFLATPFLLGEENIESKTSNKNK